MKREKLLHGIQRFVLPENGFGDKKCRLILFGIHFAKEIDESCIKTLADSVKEETSEKGMRTELRHAVEELSSHVTLKKCVTEAIEAAME